MPGKVYSTAQERMHEQECTNEAVLLAASIKTALPRHAPARLTGGSPSGSIGRVMDRGYPPAALARSTGEHFRPLF
jgi:hypothetical protein